MKKKFTSQVKIRKQQQEETENFQTPCKKQQIYILFGFRQTPIFLHNLWGYHKFELEVSLHWLHRPTTFQKFLLSLQTSTTLYSGSLTTIQKMISAYMNFVLPLWNLIPYQRTYNIFVWSQKGEQTTKKDKDNLGKAGLRISRERSFAVTCWLRDRQTT